MCMICIEFNQGRMTESEVASAIREKVRTPEISDEELDHLEDILFQLLDKEEKNV